MRSSGYTRIIVPAGMFIEQLVSLGPAKPVEVRHDKPRKTAASNVFVALILAFLLFFGVPISKIRLTHNCESTGSLHDRCQEKSRSQLRSSNNLEKQPRSVSLQNAEIFSDVSTRGFTWRDRIPGCRLLPFRVSRSGTRL